MKRILIAGLFFVSGMASASQFVGTWTGQYLVKQRFGKDDITAVTLKIVESAPSKFQATFYFHPVPFAENVENINQDSGCFAMSGSVNPKSQKISLNSAGWLGGKSLAMGDKKWTESISASVAGNSLTGSGVRNTYEKLPTSFEFTKTEESKAQLPTRCAVGSSLSTATQPSIATIGFMNAMASANYDVMETYLQKGADINCKNCSNFSLGGLEKQTSPLITAVKGAAGYGIIKMVKWLVEHGADVNQPDAYGITPTMYATRWTQSAYGAEFNAPGHGASQNDYQLLQYLLNAGGKLGIRDLSLSNAYGFLFPSGSDVGVASQSDGFEKTIRILVGAGESINLPNQFGDTLLSRAARNCADANIPTILGFGADPAVQNAMGQTPLDIALEKAQGNHPSCNSTFKLLKNSKAVAPKKPSPSANAPSATTVQPISSEGVAAYAGEYSGSYSGNDSGEFGVTISQNGSASFWSRPYKIQNRFAGSGKVDANGAATFNVGGGGPTFSGSITPSGAIEGTWFVDVGTRRLSGNFIGNKTAAAPNGQAAANPIGGLLNALQMLSR